MVSFIRSDLEFALEQIKIAEAHAAGQPLFGPGGLIPTYNQSFGIRTVDGSYNNLLNGRQNWGAADQPFPSLVEPAWQTIMVDPDGPGHSPAVPMNYTPGVDNDGPGTRAGPGDVIDPYVRMISNLVVDQTLSNPAAIAEALNRNGVAGDTLAIAIEIKAAYETPLTNPAFGGNSIKLLFKAVDDAADAFSEAQAAAAVNPTPANRDAATAAGQALAQAEALLVTARGVDPDDVGPARSLDALLGAYGVELSGANVILGNIAPDEGLSAPFNSWFTLFGQFFDHGLDLVNKGGSGTVMIPLSPDDPLYDPASNTNFMVLTRATVAPGTDGVWGTADDVRPVNTTTSFVDQNQTYASHASHQVFLREYVMTPAGPAATGKLLEGSDGGMGTWGELKAQAHTMLGINLTDTDVGKVPLLRTDAYGNFIPGANGFPQLIIGLGNDGIPNTADDLTVEGDPASPISLASAVRTNHAFLADIAHNAVPKGVADGDFEIGLDNGGGTQTDSIYDDELLEAHFIGGDGRVNENIGLIAVHHVFHAEHNRLVEHAKDVLVADAQQMLLDGATQGQAIAFLNEWLAVDVTAVPLDQLAVNALVWDGERLFQAAKLGTEMQYQHLVFEEFARKIQPSINDFLVPSGYDATIDPSIVAEFAHTVYRFGHSMLTETVDRFDSGFAPDHISLIEAFLNPAEFNANGTIADAIVAGDIVRGMTRQDGNQIDEHVTSALRNNLLGLPLDLAAINLARGRETGVPTLNEARREFYEVTNQNSLLRPYASWSDFGAFLKNDMSIINFVAAYGTHGLITSQTTAEGRRDAAMTIITGASFGGLEVPVDATDFLAATGTWAGDAKLGGLEDVDFWIGGLAEETMPFGGMLGSTFGYVFEVQLEQLQNGDRFYYLQRLQGTHLFGELEGNSFAAMIEANTNARHLPSDVFSKPAFILELDQFLQFNDSDGNGELDHADPAGVFRNGTAEVQRITVGTLAQNGSYTLTVGEVTLTTGQLDGTPTTAELANKLRLASGYDATYFRVTADASSRLVVTFAYRGNVDEVASLAITTRSTSAPISASVVDGSDSSADVPGTSEVQTIAPGPLAADGVYTLSVGGLTLTTVPLDADPDALELAAALSAHPNASTAGFIITTDANGNLVLTWTNPGDVADVATLTVTTASTGAPITANGVNGTRGTSLEYRGGEHVVLGGTAGADKLIGGIGDDTLHGDAGNDNLEGGFGNDILNGGDGDDIIQDRGGDDNIKGGAGNDAIHAGPGLDLVLGGEGKDFIVIGTDIAAQAFGGTGNDFILGSRNSEPSIGNEGDDWLENGMSESGVGDNLDDILQRDGIRGNDVMLGGDGGFDEMIMEGGDDIMVGSLGGAKVGGMSGFDWATYKSIGFGMTLDLGLGFIPDELPQDPSLQRFESVEGLSGTHLDDIIFGTDLTSAERLPGLPDGGFHGSMLDAQGIALINGLQEVLGAGVTSYSAGDILLGGGGSDTIAGGGGDDIIDGDKWLNVKIEVRANLDGTGAVLETANSMTQLTSKILSGTYNPGQLVIVREILKDDGVGDTDIAIFSGIMAEYDIISNGDGSVTVTHARSNQIDGTDTLWNIETIRFADRDFGGANNNPVTGTADISDETPTEGQTLTLDTSNIADADGLGTFSYQWQSSPDGLTWANIAGATGASFAPQDLAGTAFGAQAGQMLRVQVSFVDGAGFQELVSSGETLPVGVNWRGDANANTLVSTRGDDVADGGGGTDVVQFSGASADYDVTRNLDGSVTVVHARGTLADGTDSLLNFETLRFANGDVPIAPPNSPAIGRPAISDQTPREGQALTVNTTGITDANGLGAFSYQWLQSIDGIAWTNIAGATGASFTPQDLTGMTFGAHAGMQLKVRVSFTDGQNNPEAVESLATAPTGVNWIGNTAANTLNGTGGDDTANGQGGNDTLIGNLGNDTLSGSTGNDILDGGDGNDVLNGDDGIDTITGGAGNDTISGGGGVDVAVYSLSTLGYTITANAASLVVTAVTGGTEGADTVSNVETLRFGGVDYTTLIGANTAATTTGNASNQVISVRGGNDTVNGAGGNDIILAGLGNDRINQSAADAGRDFINGEGGTDTYAMTGTAAAEAFQILTRAAAISAGLTDLHAAAEIVITRDGAIVAELDNVEEILINTLNTTVNDGNGSVNGGASGGDTITVVGDFTQTSLNYSTITVNGGAGKDTVDLSGLTSDHRLVFNSGGGKDHVVGARPQDVVDYDSDDWAWFDLIDGRARDYLEHEPALKAPGLIGALGYELRDPIDDFGGAHQFGFELSI